MNFNQVQKLNLAILPTPLQAMPNLTKRLGCGDLYIKRDDLTDVGLSGNKVRKLEYLVYDAIQQGCNTLLTFGDAQTNHGRLTAAVAVRQNMKCILILSGKKPDYLSGNLVLDKLLGADVYFTEGDMESLAAEVTRKYQANGDTVYQIPFGGSNELGALGYVSLVKELLEQCAQRKISPRYLVASCGSLGTFGGLWCGVRYFGAPFEVIPISANPTPFFDEASAAAYINRISQAYELGVSCTEQELKFYFNRGHISYAGAGYNVPDAETRAAIRLLAETEAIFVDPCYSGKGFHGFVDMAQNVFDKKDSAIFLHTGGVPAIWSKEHLDAWQQELQGD